ncbi:MAG: nuclear transport factor 2 family protein, partial [Gaiellaceae bacterium]
PFGNATGREALRTWIDGFHEHAVGNRHMWLNHLSEEEGEGARSISYFLVLEAGSLPPVLGAIGEYESQVRKEDGRWKFARRVLKLPPGVQVPEEMRG